MLNPRCITPGGRYLCFVAVHVLWRRQFLGRGVIAAEANLASVAGQPTGVGIDLPPRGLVAGK